jgi:hypothetical protein
MRFCASVVALGLGALAATPCFALTIQAAPPSPDVAQHLRSTTTSPTSSVLPAPGDLKESFAASGRSQLGQGFYGQTSGGTTSYSFGPFQGATTVTPGYGAFSTSAGAHDSGNPWRLTPPTPH